MVKYDPRILQAYAEKLYRQASFVVFMAVGLGILLGAVFGASIGVVIADGIIAAQNRSMGVLIFAAAGVGLGLIVGYAVGQSIAFWYRLKAQVILCDKQIELNTRPARRSVPATAFDEIVA
jgi:hypothetical protein